MPRPTLIRKDTQAAASRPRLGVKKAEPEQQDLFDTLAASKKALDDKKPWPSMARPGFPGRRVVLFSGNNVLMSPMFGLATLFVVGVQPAVEIIEVARKTWVDAKAVNHIYLGANRSFNIEQHAEFCALAKKLMAEKFFVSCDVPFSALEVVRAWPMLDATLFSLVVSLPLRNPKAFGYNTTLKIDDDFRGENGGVWCTYLEELTRDHKHTPWSWFAHDKVHK